VVAKPLEETSAAVPVAAEAVSNVKAAAAPATSEQQQSVVYKTVKQLRMRSAAAYLPHPDKESYGGEDAHFVSNISGGAIGVADGKC
jgi:protein phosphatase PTC7